MPCVILTNIGGGADVEAAAVTDVDAAPYVVRLLFFLLVGVFF